MGNEFLTAAQQAHERLNRPEYSRQEVTMLIHAALILKNNSFSKGHEEIVDQTLKTSDMVRARMNYLRDPRG